MDISFWILPSLILIIFSYCTPAVSHLLECQSFDNCHCSSDYGIEYQCPKDDSEIEVRITPDNEIQMQCDKRTLPATYDPENIPELNANDSDCFKLDFCYLNTTFNNILRRFNMTNVKQIHFAVGVKNSDRIINITKETFESLESLESLALTDGSLLLSRDFLENTPNLYELYLYGNGLSSIEHYFNHTPKLEILDLSRNKIGLLPDGVFQHINNLIDLCLLGNNITELSRNMFKGLRTLSLLELSSNHIEQIDEETFSELANLTQIGLRQNKVTKLSQNIFKNNLLVKNIVLSHNPGLNLSDYVFANLKLLTHVDLSFNNLSEIPENTFRNCEKLQAVYLQENRLETIPKNTFKGLKELKLLDMSVNKISYLPEQVFVSLVNLEELNLSENLLSNIAANLFRTLGGLKNLNLGLNQISVIDERSFKGLKDSLTYLDISNNLLSSTTAINYCLNLEELILNNNYITNVPIGSFLGLIKMDLSYNRIDKLMIAQFARPKMFTYEIDLSHNEIREVDFRLDVKPNGSYTKPTNYKTEIDLTGNPIVCECSNFDLIRYNNKEIKEIHRFVSIKQDGLTCADNDKMLIKNVKPGHVQCPVLNQCPSLCKCINKPYNKTVVVDCSRKNLTSYPVIFFNETDHQQVILNMSGNQLECGPTEDLNLKNVTYLDLSRNRISEVIWIPLHIEGIDLSGNKLKKLSNHFLNMLNNSASLQQLHLKENLWDCGCDALDLQNYLKENFNKVALSDVYCQDARVPLVELTDLCKVTWYLTSVLPVFLTILLLFAATFVLYYRFQTEIKVYLYAKKLCLWFVTEEELDKDKTYDVFVSYAHQDEMFIMQHLLPELEQGDPPFKACFHVRDWIPGKFITEQIVDSVKDSRRTLVVLSNNFLDSVWGKLEFRTAHTKALSEGRARVIVVIYGDLDESKLDDEFKSYLKTNTYVKWGDRFFWNKLKYALPHSKNKFYEINKNKARLRLKTGAKLDLINSPPSPTNTSTPPISLDPVLLEGMHIKIDIPKQVDGQDLLVTLHG